MNEQMRMIFRERNFVVIDTETTGLRRPCEIIDIAILDSAGMTLMDTLIEPKEKIPEMITDLTGITNEMTFGHDKWPTVKQLVLLLIQGKDVITYNARFDRHMMHCTDDMWSLPQYDYKQFSRWACAMEAYAPHHNEWDDYYGSYRWARLEVAMEEQGLPKNPAQRAFDQARMTYRLLEHMCS